MDMFNVLLGNGSVNMPSTNIWPKAQYYKRFLCASRHATVQELCFLRSPYRVYIVGDYL
jgi:hypothetical protein